MVCGKSSTRYEPILRNRAFFCRKQTDPSAIREGRSNKTADFVHQARESNLLDGRVIYRGFGAKE